MPWADVEQKTMLDQAQRYSAGFAGGVIFVTKSEDLAEHYSDVFRNAGIANFRFVITPAEG
jgi:filamentous hemagglutinin